MNEQDDSVAGFSRRELLKKSAKAGIGASVIASFPLLKPGEAAAAVPFKTGYNDGWLGYATGPTMDANDQIELLGRIQAGGVDYLRQNVYWPQYMKDDEPQYGIPDADQTPPTPGMKVESWEQTEWDKLNWLRGWAGVGQARLLPVITGVPAWAKSATGGCKPEYLDLFGQFVAEVARKMEVGGVNQIDAIEIGNETNADNPVWRMSAQDLADMVTYAYAWLTRYRTDGLLSKEIKVISGGLFAQWDSKPFTPGNPTNPADPPIWKKYPNGTGGALMNWNEYFTAFQNAACAQYDVGLHPYDLHAYVVGVGGEKYKNYSATAHTWVANHILQIYYRMEQLTTKNIWITETGVPSREPFYQNGQASALGAISSNLTIPPRCKALIVHRLLDEEPIGNPYYGYGVIAPIQTGPPNNFVFWDKTAYGTLSGQWN